MVTFPYQKMPLFVCKFIPLKNSQKKLRAAPGDSSFLFLRPQAQGQPNACRGHGWPCLKNKKELSPRGCIKHFLNIYF